jgi:hypothetical protein
MFAQNTKLSKYFQLYYHIGLTADRKDINYEMEQINKMLIHFRTELKIEVNNGIRVKDPSNTEISKSRFTQYIVYNDISYIFFIIIILLFIKFSTKGKSKFDFLKQKTKTKSKLRFLKPKAKDKSKEFFCFFSINITKGR